MRSVKKIYKLMKKFLLKISVCVLCALIVCTSLSGCLNPEKKEKLPAPEVVIGYDGTATWSEIENTLYYVYVIDDNAEKMTVGRTVRLELNQSIKVKAVSNDSGLYLDSDYSEVRKYTSSEKPVNCTHADNDSNGKCDLCGESVKIELTFMSINDLHGKFMDTPSQSGVDELTTYLKNLYADDTREEVLLSAGDMWQGSVESSTNKGRLMTRWMNEVGFEGMALGNHEFDWGADVLKPNSEQAEFPFLAINVKYNGKPADFCQASTVVERAGIKIGVIGAIGDCLGSVSGEFSGGLEFITGSALTRLVKDEAERLRNKEDCKFIVYTIHDGYGESLSPTSVTALSKSEFSHYYDTSLSDGYIDLVFEGHTHQSYVVKDDYGVIHMQGGGENRYLSRADVSFNIITSDYTVAPKLVSSNEYASSDIGGDGVVNEIFKEFFPDDNPYTTVLGKNGTRRNSDEICKTVAKLYYETGRAQWSGYNVVLGGGYLKLRTPYRLEQGNVTYADIFSILPFDNAIVLGKIRGYDLKRAFLSDKNNYHVFSTISYSEVSDNTYYYIITDTYSAYYRYNNVTETARLGDGTYARDLLAEYVRGGGYSY